MRIEMAGADEVSLIYDITSRSFEEYRNTEVPSSALMETAEHVRQALTNGRERAIICYFDGNPAGAARFYMENGLYFRRLGVLPEYRGRGISKAIISWLEEYAREKGETRIWCNTRSAVDRNMSLYRGLGFRMTGERSVERNGHIVGVATFSKSLE